MTDFAFLTNGSIVVYVNPALSDPNPFLRAVVSGPEIADPATGETWISARLPDGTVELVDPALVVETLPANRPASQ